MLPLFMQPLSISANAILFWCLGFFTLLPLQPTASRWHGRDHRSGGPGAKNKLLGPRRTPSQQLHYSTTGGWHQVLWVSLHCIKLVYIFGIVYIFLSYHKYFILYYSCHTSLSLLMILLDLPQLMVLRHSALLDVWGSCCFALQV